MKTYIEYIQTKYDLKVTDMLGFENSAAFVAQGPGVEAFVKAFNGWVSRKGDPLMVTMIAV